MSSPTLWFTASSILSFCVSLGIDIGFLVVAFIVRRERPDAGGLLLASAILHLANLVVGWGLTTALPFLLDRGGAGRGMGGYAQMSFVVHLFTSGIGGVAAILMMMAIVRVAREPRAALQGPSMR